MDQCKKIEGSEDTISFPWVHTKVTLVCCDFVFIVALALIGSWYLQYLTASHLRDYRHPLWRLICSWTWIFLHPLNSRKKTRQLATHVLILWEFYLFFKEVQVHCNMYICKHKLRVSILTEIKITIMFVLHLNQESTSHSKFICLFSVFPSFLQL